MLAIHSWLAWQDGGWKDFQDYSPRHRSERAHLSIDIPKSECPPREGLFPEEEQFHDPALSSYVVNGRCDELGIEGYHRNAGEHGLGNENNRRWCSGIKTSYDNTIRPSFEPKLCFNVWGGIGVNRHVNLFGCGARYTNDKWELTGENTIRLKHSQKLCLMPERLAAGARIRTQFCSAAPSHRWRWLMVRSA